MGVPGTSVGHRSGQFNSRKAGPTDDDLQVVGVLALPIVLHLGNDVVVDGDRFVNVGHRQAICRGSLNPKGFGDKAEGKDTVVIGQRGVVSQRDLAVGGINLGDPV